MAQVHTSKLTIRCWKEHTCLACGGTYRYRLSRKITAQGDDANAARAAARDAAFKAIARDVEVHPCPTCGLVQPDMTGQRRFRAHTGRIWTAGVLFAPLFMLRALDVLQAGTTTWLLLVVCAGAALVLVRDEARDPNSDLPKNLRLAGERVSDGILEIRERGEPAAGIAKPIGPQRSLLRRAILAAILGASVLAAFPEIFRAARSWPYNDLCYPPVVGPGDEIRAYMDDRVYSILGFWRCSPSVMLGVGDRPPLTLTSSCPDGSGWGESITAKASQKSTSSRVSVVFRIPDDATLGGLSATAAVNLDVIFPMSGDRSTFTDGSVRMGLSLPIRFASTPGAGATYESVWWAGSLAAAASLLAGALALLGVARSLQHTAAPARVVTDDADQAENAKPVKAAKRAKGSARRRP